MLKNRSFKDLNTIITVPNMIKDRSDPCKNEYLGLEINLDFDGEKLDVYPSFRSSEQYIFRGGRLSDLFHRIYDGEMTKRFTDKALTLIINSCIEDIIEKINGKL